MAKAPALPAGFELPLELPCARSSRSARSLDGRECDRPADTGDLRAELERAVAGNVKLAVAAAPGSQSLWEISGLLELKTVWHPVGV